MAQMVPDALPNRNFDKQRITAGEKRLFAILSRLPDDCLVYYEPVVRHRHPDFIVILPSVGVLIIEVKGWWHKDIERADNNTVYLTRRGAQKHPGRQAREYMNVLTDKCRDHSMSAVLTQQSGRYSGSLIFPRSTVSVFSNINRSQLDHGSPLFREVFPPDKTVTKDRLASWERLSAEDLLAELKSCFESWFPFPALSRPQIDLLRSIVHPEIVLSSETELKILDLRQERNAREIGGGHRVIYGVAGSGKTVLLIARAKLLAEEGKQVLVLCYNRLLGEYLAKACTPHRNIRVLRFKQWGNKNSVIPIKGEADEAYGERLLARLTESDPRRPRFDALLIDESQDWPCSWFRCARLALKDPETSDLVIVGDGSQSLYRARPFTWAEAGIKARGRTINIRFDLDKNYRNTVEILEAAAPFSARVKRGAETNSPTGIVLVDPNKALRNGPLPALVELKNKAEECDYAAALIETWLRGGLDIGGRRQRLKPSDIAVLYPRNHDAAMPRLIERLSAFTRPLWLTPRGTGNAALGDDGVRILTIKASRGLQFRAVIILWADQIPHKLDDDQRSELYVGMTRAEDMLVMLHSGHSPYVEEIETALYGPKANA